jgi:hypothetical protein
MAASEAASATIAATAATAATVAPTAMTVASRIIPASVKDYDELTQPNFQWNAAIDTMLADWCDHSKCFAWMHTQSFQRYNTRSMVMSIGTNSFISLSGVANLIIGQTTDSTTGSIIFGCISIFIGIVNMIQEKFAFAALATDFKRSAQEWGYVTRKIEEQLAIPYSGRKDCATFLKYIKQDINSIADTNSLIPEDIRISCSKKFSAIKDFDIPDICGQMEHTAVYVDEVPVVPNIPA